MGDKDVVDHSAFAPELLLDSKTTWMTARPSGTAPGAVVKRIAAADIKQDQLVVRRRQLATAGRQRDQFGDPLNSVPSAEPAMGAERVVAFQACTQLENAQVDAGDQSRRAAHVDAPLRNVPPPC
ncbi:MAG: hypothetical protein R3F11_19495 [Verrucomicrobiales bacterium]